MKSNPDAPVLFGFSGDEELDLQQLVDGGLAWRLEGAVGRACFQAIEDGLIVLGPTDHRDYWGSRVPSRHQVIEGTLGSVRYAHDLHVGELGHSRQSSARCRKCRKLRAAHGI